MHFDQLQLYEYDMLLHAAGHGNVYFSHYYSAKLHIGVF
jgi:hypothetical protein